MYKNLYKLKYIIFFFSLSGKWAIFNTIFFLIWLRSRYIRLYTGNSLCLNDLVSTHAMHHKATGGKMQLRFNINPHFVSGPGIETKKFDQKLKTILEILIYPWRRLKKKKHFPLIFVMQKYWRYEENHDKNTFACRFKKKYQTFSLSITFYRNI